MFSFCSNKEVFNFYDYFLSNKRKVNGELMGYACVQQKLDRYKNLSKENDSDSVGLSIVPSDFWTYILI